MMDRTLRVGLYEQLITEELAAQLAELASDGAAAARVKNLLPAEAPDRIAVHLGRIIRRAVASLPEQERTSAGLALARELLRHLIAPDGDLERAPHWPTDDGLLLAVDPVGPTGKALEVPQPLTPLLDTALLTNAPDEPSMVAQLAREMASAEAVDLIMAFVRWSGVRPLREAIQGLAARGGRLRVLTTVYTGTTELRALQELERLGADVRISYDTTNTRLHAKAWLFHRAGEASTAFVGSSNMTHQAQVTGLEWNVRVSGLRNPDVVARVASVFDSYWEGGAFETFDPDRFRSSSAGAAGQPLTLVSALEVEARPFQRTLLEQLRFSRARGHQRNLLVAATGTGKTVMAALDYRAMCTATRCPRLLFVAHTKEILAQSLVTFRQVLRDAQFGELWVGEHRPERGEHLFASIQMLQRQVPDGLQRDGFEVVIVDEFHHAKAPTYQALLDHLEPDELLGLTATPERTDGQSVLGWFDDRIAAELRLWDAIDQQVLAPFHYYGIGDDTDLRRVPWKRGQGYDREALAAVYTGNHAWARQVRNELLDHVDNHDDLRALGFCVNVAHARFMAEFFSSHDLPAVAVDGTTAASERAAALDDLRKGVVKVLFSVDLFNEGVDLPMVNAVMLLRPTESATLFMQQLGRGLRRDRGKALCTVLDFVGQHHSSFRFDLRLRALLGGTRRQVERHVQDDFPLLPAGCHMQLDRVARQRVLDSLRQAMPAHWKRLRQEVSGLLRDGMAPELAAVLPETGLELEDLYRQNRCFSDLLEAVGVAVLPEGPAESILRRALGRLLHVDDPVRLGCWRQWLSRFAVPSVQALPEPERQVLRMLVVSLVEQVPRSMLAKGASLQDGVDLVWRHPQVLAELAMLSICLEARSGHVEVPMVGREQTPVLAHALYSRNEIQAAFGDGEGARVPDWREGVKWLDDEQVDLFVFTLDKADGQFSPTTRYNDFALSEQLIHWESQSRTPGSSETGRRYVEHRERGSDVVLFARMRQEDRAFWCLGTADYVRHRGEMPMQIVWKLRTPLPGDLFTRFRPVAG